MKRMKQYGVTKPKSLDYLLAILFAFIAVSALWIGIWIAVTKTQNLAIDVLNLSVRALTGSFAGENSLLVILESIVFYGGAFAALILCFLSLISKKHKTFAGVFALILSAVAISLQIGFFGVYLNSEVMGLFAVFVALFALSQLLVTYYAAKLLYSIVVKESKAYSKYKEEFPDSDNIKIIEVEVPVEEAEKEKEEAMLQVTHGPAEYEEDYDLIYDNSNSYRDYMYHEGIVKYMNGELDEPKPVKEEPKPEIIEENNEQNKFSGEGNNYTFEQKLRKAKPIARQYFKELKQYFESLGFKAELTKQAETFSYKNTKYAMITTAGQSGLKIHYKLNAKDYENSTIPVKDVGKVKKYEKTPLLFVAKSDLAVKRAKLLMDDVKKQYIGEDVVIAQPESKKEMQRAESKPKAAKVQEKPKEKKVENKLAQYVEEVSDSNGFGGINANHYTFEQKLNMAKPVVRQYFKELTRYFVSLGFTPAVTKSSETFSYKNTKYAMITAAGKSGLKVYYKLDAKDYKNSTIPVKDVGEVKKYEKTPLLFVAKSDLAVKRAKLLMDDVKSKLD